MPETEAEHARELRRVQEKLDDERNSSIHLRIAGVEAQAKSDRDLQAVVNQRMGDRIDGVKSTVDGLKTSTEKGFSDLRLGLMVVGLGVALTLASNAPGLLVFLKGRLP